MCQQNLNKKKTTISDHTNCQWYSVLVDGLENGILNKIAVKLLIFESSIAKGC